MTIIKIMRKTQGGVKTRIYYLANNYVNPYQPSKNNLCKQKKNNLRNNKDIIRTTPDKGNGVITVKKNCIYAKFL